MKHVKPQLKHLKPQPSAGADPSLPIRHQPVHWLVVGLFESMLGLFRSKCPRTLDGVGGGVKHLKHGVEHLNLKMYWSGRATELNSEMRFKMLYPMFGVLYPTADSV